MERRGSGGVFGISSSAIALSSSGPAGGYGLGQGAADRAAGIRLHWPGLRVLSESHPLVRACSATGTGRDRNDRRV